MVTRLVIFIVKKEDPAAHYDFDFWARQGDPESEMCREMNSMNLGGSQRYQLPVVPVRDTNRSERPRYQRQSTPYSRRLDDYFGRRRVVRNPVDSQGAYKRPTRNDITKGIYKPRVRRVVDPSMEPIGEHREMWHTAEEPRLRNPRTDYYDQLAMCRE